jgi:hypothetical protein
MARNGIQAVSLLRKHLAEGTLIFLVAHKSAGSGFQSKLHSIVPTPLHQSAMSGWINKFGSK